MAIVGTKREQVGEGFSKKVGLAVCEPLIINPDKAMLEELIGKPADKKPEYVSKDAEGNTQVELDIWLREVKTGQRFRCHIRLIDKVHKIKGDKIRFVDVKGNTSYFLDKEENLVEWMRQNTPRIAKVGEVELYKFLRASQGNINTKEITDFTIDWNSLMRGDFKEINDLKESPFATNVLVLLAIRLDNKSGMLKHYQTVYNRAFLPGNFIRYFNNGGTKIPRAYEEFIGDITKKDHGCKDFFGKDRILQAMHDYNASENPLTSDDAVLPGNVEESSEEHENDDTVAVVMSTDY